MKPVYQANYDFNTDLKIARKSERQIAQFLVKHRNMEFLEECHDNKYDIKMKASSGRIYDIEIKEDFTCQRTGNIGVEFSCRGKDSGIRVSKANIYVYKIHRPDEKIGLYLIPTVKLKQLIALEKYFRIVNGGDIGSNSLNYLFKLEVIEENFKFLGFLEN